MAENISASVTFDDYESANNILNSLKSDSNIKGAFILLNDYTEFASYLSNSTLKQKMRSNTLELLEKGEIKIEEQSSHIDFHNIIVSKPLYLHKKYIATLIIISSTKQIYSTILEVMSILFIVFLSIIVITLFISSKLQSIFTKPIYMLIEHIQYIINNSKYDKKITQNRADEFQILYDGFNALLETIDKQTKELQLLASIDPLTKLYNRRYLRDISEQIMELAKRNKTKLSVIMIDIDLFKSINDQYGHKNGDEVIVRLAKTLKSMTRSSDIVCRFGGEEFIILLPETILKGAVNVAEKIRTSVEKLAIDINQEQKIHFTISCGVSEVNVNEDKNIESSIQRADESLYKAKKNGRNRVISK